jgi:hypothetical protein
MDKVVRVTGSGRFLANCRQRVPQPRQFRVLGVSVVEQRPGRL